VELYLHLVAWPDDRWISVPNFGGRIKKAYFLADSDRANLEVTSKEGNALIRLPEKALDAFDTVVIAEIE